MSAVLVIVSTTGLRRPSSVIPTGNTVAVATFIFNVVAFASSTVPFSESVTALPGGAANSSRVAWFRYGNGFVAPPSFGCTSKWRCGVPSASPESPT
jgi:hypothetical protein